MKAPFTLATCGWVLGPPQSPALFDKSLPKQMAMACINRVVGNTPVEPGFAKIQNRPGTGVEGDSPIFADTKIGTVPGIKIGTVSEGRPKWAIPWMEDDPGLTMPQLWAGRMRRDAADSLRYGCTGLMGIHWPTRILGPNVSALAKAGWDQSGWNPELKDIGKPLPKVPEGVEGGK